MREADGFQPCAIHCCRIHFWPTAGWAQCTVLQAVAPSVAWQTGMPGAVDQASCPECEAVAGPVVMGAATNMSEPVQSRFCLQTSYGQVDMMPPPFIELADLHC